MAEIRVEEYVLTRGGLTGGIKPVVTTNCEKSAEVIVPIISGRTEQFAVVEYDKKAG
jgi:hypothetical protein